MIDGGVRERRVLVFIFDIGLEPYGIFLIYFIMKF